MNEQPRTDEGSTELKPGETITPGSVELRPIESVPQSTPIPATPVPTPAPAQAAAAPQPLENDTFPGNQAAPVEARPDTVFTPVDEAAITWTASEFITHEKSTDWYLAIGVAAVVLAALAYLVIRDWVAAIVIIVAGIGFAVYGGLKPRQQEYGLSGDGLRVGQKFYAFEEFRSFSLVDEGAFTSIQFLPLKRFGSPVSIYYDPKDEDAILQLIGTRLPLEESKNDPVDKLIKRIRF